MPRAIALLAALGLLTGLHAATLTGETSRPISSIFLRGEPVQLSFTAADLQPGQAGLTLAVTITAVDGRVVTQTTLPVTADAQGNWRGTLAGRSDRLGYYHVVAKLSTGETLPAVGSRPPGYLTYMVVTDPANRVRAGEKALFGLQGGFASSFDMRPLLGVTWVLGGYNWGQNEPDRPGQFAEKRANPDPKDAERRNLDRDLGIQPLFCLIGHIPKWAQQMKDGKPVKNVIGDLKAFGDYCRAVGKAANEDYPWLEHHVYQVTWEPVYPWGFEGTDQDLVRLYQAAYPALHETDPKAIVIGPTGAGISAGDLAWNERLLQAGLGKYVDAWAIHPYIGQPPEDHELIGNIRALREIIRTHVDRDLDLYGTEQGFPTGATQELEKPQAMWLTRSYIITVGEGFKLNTAFYSCDYPGEPGYGFFHNLVMEKQAWGPGVVGPKPVAAAFAAMTMVLEGHKPLGPVEGLGATTLGYAFERAGQVTLALWDYGKQPREISLMVGVPEVELIDWMGNPRTERASNGVLKLALGPEPLYVRGVAPALWGSKAKKPLLVQAQSLSTFAGDKLKLSIVTNAPPGTGSASSLSVRLGDDLSEVSKPLSVTPGKSATLALELPVPATVEAGLYPLQVTARSGERTWGMNSVMARVRDAVTVEGLRPLGGGKLQVALRNLRPVKAEGTLAIRLPGVPGSRATQSFALPAGKTAAVVLDLSAATAQRGRSYAATLTLQERGGLPHVSTRTITLTDFYRVPQRLKIDGNLDEWSAATQMDLSGRERLVRQPQLYRGRDDLAATVRCAWDKTALYLAVSVVDDQHVQTETGFNTWKGDCLQLAIDTQPADKQELTGNTVADTAARGNVELDLALTANGPEVYRTLSPDPAKLPVRLLTAEEAQLRVVRTPTGLRYEAALPWQSLSRSGQPPDGQLGFALAVNDMDDPKQLDPKALGLFGGITPHKTPALFGRVALVDAPAPPLSVVAGKLELDGFLGQSQPADAPALDWSSCAGVMAGDTGALWAVSGDRVYHFDGDRLQEALPLPTGMRLARGDGSRFVCLSHEGYFYEFSLATKQAHLLCKPEFPAGQSAGEFALAANGDLYALSRAGTVLRFDRDGKPLGVALQLPPQEKWDYRALGVDPVSGDLWLGTYWPDMRLLRFQPGDREPRETREGFATLFCVVGGELWWSDTAGVSHALGSASKRRKPPVGHFTYYPTGAAPAADGGSWLACAQGLVHFDALGQPTGKRLGGLAAPQGLAVSPTGSVLTLIENRQRFVRLNADDLPAAPFLSQSNEPWRVGNGWSGQAAGLAWMGEAYLVLDRASKALWRFDPDHIAWGEKPWLKLTGDNALTDPQALAVGDAQAFVLDGKRLLSFSLQDFASAPVEVALPAGTEGITALAAVGDGRFYAATSGGVMAFTERGVQWQRQDLVATDLAATGLFVVATVAKDGAVVTLDPATGKTVGEYRQAGTAPGSVAVSWPWVYATDAANSRLLRLRLK